MQCSMRVTTSEFTSYAAKDGHPQAAWLNRLLPVLQCFMNMKVHEFLYTHRCDKPHWQLLSLSVIWFLLSLTMDEYKV